MSDLTHRPAGAGQPYASSPDQRVPVLPLVGEEIRLGVVAHVPVAEVSLEWERLGAPPSLSRGTTPAQLVTASDADLAVLAGGEGHLAEAQASSLASADSWQVTVPGLAWDELLRYRFTATSPGGLADVTTGWFEVRPAQWQDGAPISIAGAAVVRSRLVPGTARSLADAAGTVHRVKLALRLEPDEHVVGFGERYDAVDQRGLALDARVFEQYKSQYLAHRTYLPMPFAHVVSPTGSWGFHVRTSRRTWFDVGHTDRDLLWIEAATGPDGGLEIASYTGTPTQVLTGFLDEVGRARELPAWVLRLWASGNEWNTQDIVMDRMDHHRDLEIPVGAVVIEAWSDEEGIMIFRDAQYDRHPDGAPFAGADFRYPPGGAWPDPAGMVRELHERGIRVILWQIPLLKTRADLPAQTPDDAQVLADGAALVRDGMAVLEDDGTPYHNRGWWFPGALMPDLSTVQGRAWWTERRRYLVRDLDIDGFKTDGGEHSWGDELRYGDGRRGDEGNNVFPVHYVRAFCELLESEGKAPVTFSRSGFTGSQAHGIYWAGDEDSTWEALRASVTAGITAAACGIVYWGWDLAGFSGPVPEPELYIRAASAATFMPIMQYHSEFNHHRQPQRDRTPWWVAEVHHDPSVIDDFRELAQLRERLLPYLATAAHDAVTTDRPFMRALFFDHPDDPEIWQYPHEFLLGDDLLVHPVTQPGVTTWSSYLPAGDWIDAWDGSVHSGPTIATRPVPRHITPVYIRASARHDLRGVFPTS